ncbi:Ni/Fe hydrogenase subunit alpha [[Eubacterium] cellulosolvens]
MKRITINPITRLEGHGKIEIFLNDQGNVANAYLQIPELRGFEKFCEGRKAEDMPQLTTRICGVCPVAHHFASTKALDKAFQVEPPSAAIKLRELIYCGYIIYDHILHFYFLGGPDFLVGPDKDPESRNIIGVIKKFGLDVGKEIIKHRAYGQQITTILGGKATHPVCGLPGGVSQSLSDQDRQSIEEMAKSCTRFAKFSLQTFKDIVLRTEKYHKLIMNNLYSLRTHYMGLVDRNDSVNFYDGDIQVVDHSGKKITRFSPDQYLDIISEHTEEWSYSKFPYLKSYGWNGLKEGEENGLYRVGPLARLNVAEGMATLEANQEYQEMYDFFGEKPVHSSLAYHWARLIELLYASERALELVGEGDITSKDIRNQPRSPGEGIGVVEAARGTLIHHYQLDDDSLIKRVNLIVATTHNYPSICLSVKKAAQGLIKNGIIKEGLLNMIEMAFRTYDPCFACATHLTATGGGFPLSVKVYDFKKNLIYNNRNF